MVNMEAVWEIFAASWGGAQVEYVRLLLTTCFALGFLSTAAGKCEAFEERHVISWQ